MDNFHEVAITSQYENKAFKAGESPASPLASSSSSAPRPVSSSREPPIAHLSINDDEEDEIPSHGTSKNPVTAITTISTASNDVKATATGVVVGANDPSSSPPEDTQGNIKRNRPYSSSVMSRTSNFSTRSRVSLSSTLVTSDDEIAKLFSYKEGTLDEAVETCKRRIFGHKNEVFKGAWLLTEINTWNMEFEKLFVLTDQTLYMVKYNFITRTPSHYRFIPLANVSKLQIADLTYPSWTLVKKRDQGAVRVFSGPPPGLMETWNPYSVQTNVLTISHHPTVYNRKEADTSTYNADDFAESLLTEVNKIAKKEGRDLIMDESPILIKSYVGILSMIHNQSKFGFNVDRNGVNF